MRFKSCAAKSDDFEMVAESSAKLQPRGVAAIFVAAITTIAETNLPASPNRSSMHPGCCPTTGLPTNPGPMWMAHILGEAGRREGAAALVWLLV